MAGAVNEWVVLFESAEDGERLYVACGIEHQGGMVIRQESAGSLTRWCFEESPHRIDVLIGREQVQGLMGHFAADDLRQLACALAAAYGVYDASLRIRHLMRRLGVCYEVREHLISR